MTAFAGPEPSSEILATLCRVFGMTILDLVDAELRMTQAAVLVTESRIESAGHPCHRQEPRADSPLIAA